MSHVQHKSSFLSSRCQESIITDLLEWIPRKQGIALRNYSYRHIWDRLGTSVLVRVQY